MDEKIKEQAERDIIAIIKDKSLSYEEIYMRLETICEYLRKAAEEVD